MATLVRVWDDPAGYRDAGTERVLVGGRVLRLERSPGGGAPSRPPLDEHLVAGPGETSRTLLSCADVIVRNAGEPVLHRAAFPGCLVVAVNTRDGCLLAAGGWSARLVPVLGETCAEEDASAYASAVHAWMVAGRPLGALTRLTALRGNTVAQVRVRDPAAQAGPAVQAIPAAPRRAVP
ncbi:hypothetical protein [Actinomadura mexicana]|uniref:Uncharacterized protein n=1 Tax=Actinomadura mexicana TaxID=134959 RepID=A0A238UV31_9ACTN|nr:hypothetical protein [Actinomadura mexicana]SNR25866.1 hypothetical protein SAMN06265355_101452 [Actinomadura mexicana]